jgi:outer membrane lipoprotein-sorting protein
MPRDPSTRLAGPPAGRWLVRARRQPRAPQAGRLNGVVVFLVCLLAAAAAPSTQPTDPALWAEMQQVDAVAGRAAAVSADFRQEKFTPMLRRPLVSTGRVVARGPVSLWTTAAPRPSAMRVTPTEIRIYYPDQAVIEVYPVQGQLGALAASPLPRLDVLRQFFTFNRLPSADAGVLNLKLTPSNPDLQQHVREVDVALDRRTGAIRQTQTTDADGERTVLSFDHVDLHPAVADADLDLSLPPGTREVHPLAGLAPATDR